METIQINKNKIGTEYPVYIIAELSANHNQDFNHAVNTIKAMKSSGADAVKIQSFTPDSMTIDLDQEKYQTRKDSNWAGMKLYDLYKKAFLPYDWVPKLKQLTESLGMDFFSSPFDLEAIDFLERLNIPAYKIASFEINDIPLIKKAAATGKPIIISTGVANIEDIENAVDACRLMGNYKIILLKCTSAYPTPMEEVNLLSMVTLKNKFGVEVGLSDHTTGVEVPIGATVLGARVIEKHFILDRKVGGLDEKFSLEPNEFKQMVDSVRNIEKALGTDELIVTNKMKSARRSMRSLIAIKEIKEGQLFSENNIKSLRPNLGIHPKYYEDLLGKKAKRDFNYGDPILDIDLS